LGNGKLAEKLQFHLELVITRHGHNDHVALSVLGYKCVYLNMQRKEDQLAGKQGIKDSVSPDGQ